MNNQYQQYAEKFDALAPRERGLIGGTTLVALVFLFWWLVGEPVLKEIRAVDQRSTAIETETLSLTAAADQIEQRIAEGVHKPKQERLAVLQQELERVSQELEQKAFELINPNDMFELMGEMLFRESRLTLTELKRKQVGPVFEPEENSVQPDIFRHVMKVGFSGKYPDILSYIDRLEKLEWKLIWDSISLTTDEYPKIQVEIEISTLSDSRHWVGL